MDLNDKKQRWEIGRTCACFNLRRAARLVTQRFERAFKDTGVTASQFSVLMAAYNEEGLLLTRMAKLLGMDRTSLTRNLNVMERRELIEVVKGEDKRERRIKVTEEGRTLLEQSLPLWQKAQEEFIDSMGAEKWKTVLEGLHEIARKG